MCIPIYPNTNHPNGRAPVQPEPEGLFPYSNCYHWYQPIETGVRIRARPEEFDETNAVSLSAFTQVTRIDFSFWEENCTKMCANLDALEAAAVTSAPTQHTTSTHATTPSRPTPPAVWGTMRDSDSIRVSRTMLVGRPDVDNTFTYSGSCSARTVDSDNCSDYSGDVLGPINPFSAPDEDVELVPMVDVWVSELAHHLKQDDIPHPSELVAEVEQLTGIVQRASVRAYTALTAPPAMTPSTSNTAKPKRFRLAATWTRVCTGAKKVAVRLRSYMRTSPSSLRA
ncbi:hypothetical protein PYCCODRAFT_1261290 [Trametes coccinea BRFM310]|uniref:Uncharacterized protein n=1 Tax=Trametes coccinea (strain BRFM310) TaxID=1353009 RepID=A0A1Y2I675_TRAC3|nr:hypothetical protein PYCCODRAFT_1261290 [Trametes coccinea BRFM310]